jgi:CDP-diacylglycerol--serine O-phosphatidyltransferase
MAKRWSPNVLTATRLALGFASIAATVSSYWLVAAGLVLLAALYDSWDNRVARRLNTTAEFARDIDMLSDLIIFGLAPATLYFFTLFSQSGVAGYLLAMTYPAACAFRLARYTVAGAKAYYPSDPLPIAGPVLSGLALAGAILPTAVHVMAILLTSVLVISTVRILRLW